MKGFNCNLQNLALTFELIFFALHFMISDSIAFLHFGRVGGLKESITPHSSQRRYSGAPTMSFWNAGVSKSKSASSPALKKRLLEVARSTDRGRFTTDEQRKEIETIISQLKEVNPAKDGKMKKFLNRRWKLEWTTEQEVLFIIEKGLFGLPVTDIFQDIDSTNNFLQNRIEFEEDSFFSVKSSCMEDEENETRVNFKFQSCSAKWKNFSVPLPPFGQGWFDNIYLDDDIRINSDSRGDLQITTPSKG